MMQMPPRWFVLPAATVLAGSAALAASAQGEPETTPEDQGLVDLFFKDKITAVRRTRDTDDDVALIAEILEQAENVPDSPAVQWLMYETAVDLGMTSEVYGAAIDAALAMRAAFPEADAVSDESMLVLMEQAYRGARRGDREEVAEPYLAMLLEVAGASEEAGDVDRAGRLYRTGVSVARVVRSEQEEVFEGHVRRLNEIEQLNSRVRMLESALEANPRNGAAARELTMIYVLDRRDLSAAAGVVELTRDADLIDAVTMGAGGAAEAGPVEALRVGDWYLSLSEEHEDHAAYLLGESLAFYDRFLEVYERDDALRSRASTMRVLVSSRLDELVVDDAEGEQVPPGEWVDALARFDRAEHTARGRPRLEDGQLVLDRECAIVVPFEMSGGYDIRLRTTFEGGRDGLVFYLPLGPDAAAVFQYSRHQHTRIQIDSVAFNDDKGRMLTPGRQVEVMASVRLTDRGRVSIVCYLNQQEVLDWTGTADELTVGDGVAPPREFGNVLTIRTGGDFIFEQLHVRRPER